MKSRFLFQLLAFAMLPIVAHASADTASIVVDYQMRGPVIHPHFAGLSFERQAMLPDASGRHYFDTTDTALVNIFRTLGIRSIRIGGNSLEKKGSVAPSNNDIDHLFYFARAVGAKVIYSFPLDSTRAEEDARQAAHIWSNHKAQLLCFAIGNEPGKKKDYKAFYRPTWSAISRAVAGVAPGAEFCGPDDNPNPQLSNMMWNDFGPGHGPLTSLSLHSYPIGCAYINVGKEKDPRKFIALDSHLGCDSMLSAKLHQTYSNIFDEMQPVYERAPFRLSETSNYWYGGLEGASNAYATALWAVDYMYWWAWRGCQGVNFHSGDRVGAESRTAWYTPFSHKIDGTIDVAPLSYAIKLFDTGGHGRLVPVSLSGAPKLVSAYASYSDKGYVYLTIINRSPASASPCGVKVSLQSGTRPLYSADCLAMRQRDDDTYATRGITIGGDSIRPDGTLPLMRWTRLAPADGEVALQVLPSSVVILKLNVANTYITDTRNEPVLAGKFKATWNSLSKYEVPEWFRDAKFGIWAHWGPQSVPEYGDWYARFMYKQGSRENKYHLAHYGHPSVFGFKDLVNLWRPDNWQPDRLIKLYKRAGAKYFVAMANHHDNFDNWDSRHHSWKATLQGPKRDILSGWERAARDNGLRFGISIHASRAWNWYDLTENADKTGPMKGVPYDGKLTRADGKGLWWDGMDPQVLYARGHSVAGSGATDDNGTPVAIPDSAWCGNYFDRTMDAINQTRPDLVYFDDTTLPLWPVSDAGLQIASHYYNSNMLWHDGVEEGVITAKVLSPEEQECLVWDVERGALDHINPHPWQTCTCLGSWHYDRTRYTKNTYKTALRVVRMLADIVSKNGNMLLSVPVRADGSIDDREEAILDSMATWMETNGESIFGTRPWSKFGEGPDAEEANPMANKAGFNEKNKAYTPQDMRFTSKGNVLYAILFNRANDGKALIKSLAGRRKDIKRVEVLGQKRCNFICDADGLKVTIDPNLNFVPVVKVLFNSGVKP